MEIERQIRQRLERARERARERASSQMSWVILYLLPCTPDDSKFTPRQGGLISS